MSKTVKKMAKHVKFDDAVLQSLIFNIKSYSQILLSIHSLKHAMSCYAVQAILLKKSDFKD